MQVKLPVLLSVLTILAAILACSLFTGGGEMSLENVRTAFDSDGNDPTTVFSSSDVF